MEVIEVVDVNDDIIVCTPPELRQAANAAAGELLPAISRAKYDAVYKKFRDWIKKRAAPITETVVFVYFDELKQTYAPTTLWSTYSMLKATLELNDNIDISKFSKVLAMLKRYSDGYKSKKANVLSEDHVQRFLQAASDSNFLVIFLSMFHSLLESRFFEFFYNQLFTDICVGSVDFRRNGRASHRRNR